MAFPPSLHRFSVLVCPMLNGVLSPTSYSAGDRGVPADCRIDPSISLQIIGAESVSLVC